MATALSPEKMIDMAARQWSERMKDAVSKGGQQFRIGIDAVVIDRRIEHIDLPYIPRLKSMAG